MQSIEPTPRFSDNDVIKNFNSPDHNSFVNLDEV